MKLSNFVIILLVLGLAGCMTTAPNRPKPTRAEKAEIESIHKSFTIIVRGMVEGDLKTVYQYLSALQRGQQSYDEFAADHEQNKSAWQSLFRDAYLKYVSVEENKASVVIIWGTGENALGEFIKEKGIWKLNFTSGPASIMPLRPVEK